MAYPFPYYGQPPQYQDQLNQLRGGQIPPMQMMQPQTFPPRQDGNGILWVQGEAGAKSWFVAPGSTVLLMDSEGQRFYLKSADPSGVPAMRTFEYSEVGAAKAPEQTETKNYVTVEEFTAFKNEVLGKLEEPVEVSLSRKKKGEANE
jgi:hypothetical protein